VKMVGRGVVDHLHVGVVDQRLITPVAAPRAERRGLRAAGLLTAAGDGNDVDKAQTPDGIDVMRPDEAGPDQTHPDPLHGVIILVRFMARPFLDTAVCVAAIWLAATGLQAQRGRQGGAPAPPPGGRGQASPASVRPPQPAAPQTYAREQIDAGRTRFAAQCGFCHGRDAAGGEGGTDLTRSALVASDIRGDRIRPLLRIGRPDKGMPAFSLGDEDVTAIVAFIHEQQTQAAVATGGRRAVDISDLQTGNVEAGRRYFDAACTKCHAAGRDLAGIATRVQGLQLLQRMLYPGVGRAPGSAPQRPTVSVMLASGEVVTGTLAYRDEFTIALTDAAGWYRSWAAGQIKFTVDDPLQAHVEQLARYTDGDMHDVLAYLQTLR
jgi:cytochrome c oxidase cbb3-type subunit III